MTAAPILDQREKQLIKKLQCDYQSFRSPGFFKRSFRPVKNKIAQAWSSIENNVPGVESAQRGIKDALHSVSTRKIVQDVLSTASEGGSTLLQLTAQWTLSRSKTVSALQDEGIGLDGFRKICALRSYTIEPVASTDWASRGSAIVQGAGTGAIGGPHGLILNLAASLLLFFRASQRIALYYGYDAIGRDSERALAAEVALQSLSSGDAGGSEVQSLLGKMMMASETEALRRALSMKTYEEMARRGYSELLYVRLRSVANKAAQQALDRAGKKGIDNGLLRRLLEGVSRRLPKRAGRRMVPVLSGLIGGALDTYYMDRVLRGANLVYHKRFLMEKQERVRQLG